MPANPRTGRRAALAALFFLALPLAAQTPYYPERDAWERRTPEQVGMDAAKLQEAIAYAQANEMDAPRDLLEAHFRSFAREPFGEAIGPFKERGPQTGVILRNGYIVAEWGQPDRVDMTFSVTKSFLSTVVGLAYDRGLIRSVDDAVAGYMPPVILDPGDGETGLESPAGAAAPRTETLFASEHNRKITWDMLLRQTSAWSGTLFGKPDWSDRPTRDPSTWFDERAEPGTEYEYNDTRVNLLALAALQVWREPLPEVLREHIMDPIGASTRWRWYGYDNSWVLVDGQLIQSVSGGGHWGGGMMLTAYDQARFGLLTLRHYNWKGEQLVSEDWFRMATTPGSANPGYGFMNFFLNTGQESYPNAPASAWTHLGSGTNMIYCDPENDLVVVARWISGPGRAGLVERVLAALQ